MPLASARGAELRGHFLSHLDATRSFSQPLRRVGRDGQEPVWAWLPQLVRQRSDWLPAIGSVLRHLALSDDALAHIAIADVLAGSLHSVALHP